MLVGSCFSDFLEAVVAGIVCGWLRVALFHKTDHWSFPALRVEALRTHIGAL
ncbi:hypothetical protein CUJ84_Chr001135 [Rhizobium leguminosarum]|uniref:Uncharacterized protein n=1 Tax=Rhizobium leguminosarum TaxID=384 RepID=A0A2K9YZX7_RHILE|nr:hypothetical protein CUJ84_Chr001135 [Rhizobium leguminosarum]